MAAQLPYSIVNFNLFLADGDHSGKVEEVILPTIEYKTEEIFNAGMSMPIKQPVALQAMSATFKMSEHEIRNFAAAGSPLAGFVTAILYGHLQSAEGKTSQIIYTMRGSISKIENGTAKVADLKAGQQTLVMDLMSLLVIRDGIPAFEVDAKGGVLVHGVFDHFASLRKNLKLA
jgi:P2 family phage contractile tail tube protein